MSSRLFTAQLCKSEGERVGGLREWRGPAKSGVAGVRLSQEQRLLPTGTRPLGLLWKNWGWGGDEHHVWWLLTSPKGHSSSSDYPWGSSRVDSGGCGTGPKEFSCFEEEQELSSPLLGASLWKSVLHHFLTEKNKRNLRRPFCSEGLGVCLKCWFYLSI